MGKAVVKVSKALLAQLLRLPEGHKVYLVEDGDLINGVGETIVDITITGDSLPEVVSGEVVPEATLTYIRGQEHSEIILKGDN